MVERSELVSEASRKEKQGQRDADAQALANGEITQSDLARRHGLLIPAQIVRFNVNYKRGQSRRLRGGTIDMTKNEIIAIFQPRFATKSEACEWYASSPIPGFNSKTADQLVKDGLSSAVISFIKSVDAGIYT